MNAATALERFRDARRAMLATAGSDGAPHLVPVVFALAGAVAFTAVDHKRKGTARLRRLRNIAENPRVAMAIDHYEEAWEALWWVRVDGSARVLEDLAEVDEALDLLAAKYRQYRQKRPAGPVVAIRLERVIWWSQAEGSGSDHLAVD